MNVADFTDCSKPTQPKTPSIVPVPPPGLYIQSWPSYAEGSQESYEYSLPPYDFYFIPIPGLSVPDSRMFESVFAGRQSIAALKEQSLLTDELEP